MIQENETRKQIGVVGLGLIGGSFAKAYAKAGHAVYAHDADASVLQAAIDEGTVTAPLQAAIDEGTVTTSLQTRDAAGAGIAVADCDLILICLYPAAAIAWMEEAGPHIGAHPLVIDCCGTKRAVCREGFRLARKYGFSYIGGHPMAGTQFSGYANAKADLYVGAPMVLVPNADEMQVPGACNSTDAGHASANGKDEFLIARAKELLAPAGFATYSCTTADAHDRLIAFTSQLAHVVSNAYVKSPAAQMHEGFSAGSYRDLTRVAWLNPEMWAELFLDNRDHLIEEVDLLIGHLVQYKEAMQAGDREELIRLLAEGKALKEQVDAD